MIKLIEVKSCHACPLIGDCKAWKNLTPKQRFILKTGKGIPQEFILKDCPIPGEKEEPEEISYQAGGGDFLLKFQLTPEKKNEVVKRVIAFFEKFGCISGESLVQMDEPVIHAPELLSELFDEVLQPSDGYEE